MSRTKGIDWFNRPPCGSKNNVYLFWKSFEALQNKDVMQAASSGISKSGAGYSDAEMKLISDPVLMYILGLDKRLLSLDEIVGFYAEGAEKHQDGLPFIDLCLYFNKVLDAQKFALDHHLDFKISIFDEKGSDHNSIPQYDDAFSKSWLKLLEQNNEVPIQRRIISAELLGFALRFATGNKRSVVCEMAGRGYMWDSFILMSIFYPTDNMTKQLQSVVYKLYELDEQLSRFSPCDEEIAHLGEVEQEPSYCYEQVKLNLIEHIDDEFVRSASYTELRLCLVSAVCNDVGDLAYFGFATDLYEFAVSEPTILAEFLPAMQKNFFEQAFVVMSDLIKAVLHLCNVSQIGLIEEYTVNPRGLIHSLVAGWVELDVIPKEESSLGRFMKGISDIIYTFIGDVSDCDKIHCLGEDCKQLVLLALRIGEVMFNSKLGDRNDSFIFDIINNSKECQEFIPKLLQKFSSVDTTSSLIDKMAISLHSTMLNVGKLMEWENSLDSQVFPTVNSTDLLESHHAHTVPASLCETNYDLDICNASSSCENLSVVNSHYEETVIMAESDGTSVFLESTSIDSLSIHKEGQDDVVISMNKITGMYSEKNDSVVGPSTNRNISKTALDLLFEHAGCSSSHDVSEKKMCASNDVDGLMATDEEIEDSSTDGCNSVQSAVKNSDLSSQPTLSGTDSALSEVYNSSAKISDVTRSESLSSNFDTENIDIWANGRQARERYNGTSFSRPLGKISNGFGGMNEDCQTAIAGFVDFIPQIHTHVRGGFRRGGYSPHSNADTPYTHGVDAVSLPYHAGYVHRGSTYRRGAYVPRGNRGVFN